jgi:hypothetical protein
LEKGHLTPPDQIDLDQVGRALRLRIAATVVVLALALTLAYHVLPAWFQFPIALADRLAFAIQASVFVLFCVVVGIFLVADFRRRSRHDVGGSAAGPPSERLAIRIAFLQNTLEQAVAAVVLYLALATLLAGDLLVVIPVLAAFFVIGRVLFLRGYAKGAEGRALGMVMTMLPTLLGYVLVIGWLLWRLVS